MGTGRPCQESRLEGDVGAAIGSGLVVEGRLLEDDTLIVSFAVPFAFDAILTHRAFLAALDATFATCQAASLGSLPGQLCLQGGLSSRSVSRERAPIVVEVLRLDIWSHAIELAGK